MSATPKQTKAAKWLERIDKPVAGVDRSAVRRMKGSATEVFQDASPRCTDLYVFSDDSGLWEKRQDDWFIAEQDTIAAAHENN
jgi:hypothetical protein